MRGDGYVISGGGTGGHVFPALALAGEIRRRRPDAPIVFVGTERGLEKELVPRAGFPLELVRVKGLVGKSPRALLSGLTALPKGLSDSWKVLAHHRPRAVVGVGGYASGPVVASARLRGVPTVIHESNAVPGVTNRLLAKIATRVAVGSEAARAALPRAVVVGNPVRPELFAVEPLEARDAARRLSILVVGGSQGAEILNRLVPPALASLRARGVDVDVVHQCGAPKSATGATTKEAIESVYEAAGFPRGVVREFLHDMAAAYGAADLVVARAGAMTVAEICAAGRPALFVPFARATHGHQEANARALERAGAAKVLTEPDADVGSMTGAVASLLADPPALAAMGRAARSLARPDAAARLCDLVFEVEA